MMSRTNMKLQMMREQTQQLERQEAAQMHHQLATSAPQSSAIQVPIRIIPVQELALPKQIFRVQTLLENPTRFHIQQKQRRQLRQFLDTQHASYRVATPPQLLQIQEVPPPIAEANNSGGASASSLCSPASAAISSTATSPLQELDEFWDDFQQLETGMDSDVNLIEPTLVNANLPNTVPNTSSGAGEYLELYPADNYRGQVSSSCPAELSPSSASQDDFLAVVNKDRQKKDNHNMIERRRRFNINDRIKELGTLLPKSNDQFYDLIREQRQNKGTILKASCDYVRVLKKEIQRIPGLEMEHRKMEQTNRRLMLRIQNLEQQMLSHGIVLEETTTTFRPFRENELSMFIKQEPMVTSCSGSSSGIQCESGNSTPTTTTGLPLLSSKLKEERLGCTRSPSPSSSGLSSAPSACSPPNTNADDYDFMDDDFNAVNGDPMLSSVPSHQVSLADELLCPDRMEEFLV